MIPQTSKQALEMRIRAHELFGNNNIDLWIQNMLSIHEGERVLDIGCGTGKQLIPACKSAGESGSVVGVDIDKESISDIKDCSAHLNDGSMDDLPALVSDHAPFDIAYSCFAIYNSKYPLPVLNSVYQLLDSDGRLFLCGPGKNNNSEINALFGKIADIPKSIISVEIMMTQKIPDYLKTRFRKVDKYYFLNSLHFPSVDEVMNYFMARTFGTEYSELGAEFKNVVEKEFENKNEFVTTKRILGISAYK